MIFEHIIRTVMLEAKAASASTQAKRDLLNSEEGSRFIPLTASNRVGNKEGISGEEFKNILQKALKLGDVEIGVLGPNQGGNPSSKFNAYTFPYKGGKAMLILAGKGKVESERQERSFITAVNSTPGTKKLVFNNRTIEGVTKATKTQKAGGYKHEPYSDIDLTTAEGTKKISAKGLSALSLGGGGLTGLDTLNDPSVNKFIEQFYDKAEQEYRQLIDSDPELKGKDLQGNPKIKDKYELIPLEFMNNILRGTKAIGGPIDYYFVGDINAEPRIEGNTITFDGDLLTVEELVKKAGTFYLRLLKREGPCYFTDKKNEKLAHIDVPKIFATKPDGSGGTQSRLFITNRKTSGYYKEHYLYT